MTTTIENHKGQQFEVELHYSHVKTGHGTWQINCEVEFKGQKRTFKELTHDSIFIDDITDMRADNVSHEEIQAFYHRFYVGDFEERILELIWEVAE